MGSINWTCREYARPRVVERFRHAVLLVSTERNARHTVGTQCMQLLSLHLCFQPSPLCRPTLGTHPGGEAHLSRPKWRGHCGLLGRPSAKTQHVNSADRHLCYLSNGGRRGVLTCFTNHLHGLQTPSPALDQNPHYLSHKSASVLPGEEMASHCAWSQEMRHPLCDSTCTAAV